MNILNIIGISAAYAADTATPATTGQSIISMLPLFLILILFMYFMVIRPQAKRAKEQKNLMGNLKKGDEILTSSGILGKIEKIGNDFLVITVADGVNLNVQKNAIISVVPKGTAKSIE
jgi:preprotein translocase subunit YajC